MALRLFTRGLRSLSVRRPGSTRFHCRLQCRLSRSLSTETQRKVSEIALRLRECKALYILAGAGIGVDSGLPDFRSDGGFWKEYPPLKDLGLEFQHIADPQWFESDPGFAWAFYGHRLSMYRRIQPHKGFEILKEIGESMPESYFVTTSNVDGHFQKAGFDPAKIYECHGSIHHLQCVEGANCVMTDPTLFPNGIAHIDELESQGMQPISDAVLQSTGELKSVPRESIPKCLGKTTGVCECPFHPSQCFSRPNILMFNDLTFHPHRILDQYSSMKEYFRKHREHHSVDKKLAVIEVGAGKTVPTVRIEAEEKAQLMGHVFVRINTDEQDCLIKEPNQCAHHFSLQGSAMEMLTAIYDQWSK